MRRLHPLCDRIGLDRVRFVVDRFYDRLLEDPIIGHHFSALPDLAAHKRRITAFWWIAMGGQPTAVAEAGDFDMLGRHAPLGLTADDFERWLAVFGAVLDDALPPELARQWLQMATGIATRLRGQLGI